MTLFIVFWAIALIGDLLLLGATFACLDKASARWILQRILWVAMSGVMLWNSIDQIQPPWRKF